MSIGVQCQSCGMRFRVSDDRAGGTITCQCGAEVAVEGVQYLDKICAGCGIDLASLTRTRDSQGNYYCQECWDERVRAQRAAAEAAREPEMAWITQQLSRVHLRLLRPLMVLALVALFPASWYRPAVGLYAGGALLVGGALLLGACWVWLYLVPFKDGWDTGMACLTDQATRREWARKNPDYQLYRPTPLVWTAIFILAAGAGLFALGMRMYRESPV